jgi:hypothetical protein
MVGVIIVVESVFVHLGLGLALAKTQGRKEWD